MRQLWSSLRFRLLVLVVFVTAPLLVLTLQTARTDRRRQVEAWRQRALDTVRLATREEDELIEGIRQLLLAVGESGQVRFGRPEGCTILLSRLLEKYPRYANLGVIRTNGEVLASALPLTGPVNLADRAFFRRALLTRTLSIGDYQIGRITGRATLNFGLPVLDRFGQVQVVVFAALDLDWLNRFEYDLQKRLPEGATWTRIDRNGTILVRHPAPDGWIGQPFPEPSLLKTIWSRGDGVVEATDSGGDPGFYAFASARSPLVAGDVATILGIPKRVLFGEANRRLNRDLRQLGIAAGLALLIGWIGSRILVFRPIRSLVQATVRLGSGELGVRTGLAHGRDELGQLARAFDQMAGTLEQRQSECRRAEEALVTREKMIRELPSLPLAVYVCDTSGVIEIYNRTAPEQWGWEPESTAECATRLFCGSFRMHLPDGTFLPHDESPMAEVLRSGLPVRNRELIIERPDGSRITVVANVVPIRDPQGQMVGAISCQQDITERKLAEERLREYSQRLQVLSRRLVEVQESERRHIARELHDEIGQALTAVALHLQAALKPSGPEDVAPRLKQGLEVVENLLEQVRDLSLNLRPSMLDDLGLEPALRWYTDRQASLSGLEIQFQADALECRLDPVIETACFRVAQEALTNVVRHARARCVSVRLRQSTMRLHLSVRDDGVGFPAAAAREQAIQGASLGLLSMEERASLAGGGMECKSGSGKGTEIHAWFPLKWQKAQK